MAINFLQMLGQLRMGVDIMPLTDSDQVPYLHNSCHIPVYTLRVEGEIVQQGPVDVLVEAMHLGDDRRMITLYEDEYPVFGCDWR